MNIGGHNKYDAHTSQLFLNIIYYTYTDVVVFNWIFPNMQIKKI